MYSPKIKEDLIPVLFRLAKNKRIPMTQLLDQFIRDGLEKEGANQIAQGLLKGGEHDRKRQSTISRHGKIKGSAKPP